MNIIRAAALLLALSAAAFTLGQARFIDFIRNPTAFPIAAANSAANSAATIYVDSADYESVSRAATDLAADIERVSGQKPSIVHEASALKGYAIVIGSVGKNALLDQLAADRKIDVTAIAGKWEASLIQTIANPGPGLAGVLVIAGSDQRGAIFAAYDISEQIGVSPWYYWAGVPVQHRDALFVKPNTRVITLPPAVKYRGVLFHDEGPALTGWAKERFGGDYRQFYEKAFELILRLRGNFMWPAMWGSAFRDNSPLSKLARDYGIVTSTPHVERGKDDESIMTIDMRGDGDLATVGYYERGARVPEDATLLWPDDNWGDIRRLPAADERSRSGGAGIYYHFDSAGGPRNERWLNTNPIAKIWEQMTLSYQYGADRIWVVDAGDPKPMAFPLEFFLNLAWNPNAWPKEKMGAFGRLWAEREFGPRYAGEIASLIEQYTRYNGRRKPELLDSANFSLTDYLEADNIEADWKALAAEAEQINSKLPQDMRPVFFDLVLFPIKTCEQVNELYIAASRNKLYAAQGRASANDQAAKVRTLFQAEPRQSDMPAVKELTLPETAALGVVAEGTATPGDAALPQFDMYTQPRRYIDVFNKGQGAISYAATATAPWVTVTPAAGRVEKDQRLWVAVDWKKAPAGKTDATIQVASSNGDPVTIKLTAFNPAEPRREAIKGFVESNGVVSIEAAHFTNRTEAAGAKWEVIPDYGRTLSGVAVFPFTAPSKTTSEGAPSLEYRMYLFSTGTADVDAIIGPTQNFVPGRGLRMAIGFDAQTPQVIDTIADLSQRAWEISVRDSVRHVLSKHQISDPGSHTLKIWMVDPGVVIEKLVVNLGGLKPSYLGPPESYHR